MQISPDWKPFSRTYLQKTPQVVWTVAVGDLETCVSVFLKLAHEVPLSFLCESVLTDTIRERYSFLGLNPDVIWRCYGTHVQMNRHVQSDSNAFVTLDLDPLTSLRHLIQESRITLPPNLPSMSAGLFGFLGYDMVRLMERLPNTNPDTLGIPHAVFMRPTIVAIFDNLDYTITFVTPSWPNPLQSAEKAYKQAQKRLSDVLLRLNSSHLPYMPKEEPPTSKVKPISNMTRQAYYQVVEKAKAYIHAGDIFQVVPSQRLSFPFSLPSFAFYRALRLLNPSPFLFYFHFGDFVLAGSSPEIMVRLRDNNVTLRPIAGTRPRGKNAQQDRKLAKELLKDPKERAEHLMLLDLGRNDVGRVACIGSVHVTEQMIVEYYSHVMHLVSNVEGSLAPEFEALDALIAGFPAGTVSGAPKIRAMEIIDELENCQRSFYAGCVGYFSANGDMDTCITLRTALVKDGMMHVQAGGGVVAESVAKNEYQETLNKAQVLIHAAQRSYQFISS